MNQLSPTDISTQIDDLTNLLANLEAEAARIALAATEGDEVAASRLGQINGEIDAMKADRVILQRARSAAQARAADQSSAADAAARATARDEAKAALTRLLDAARRADALATEWKEVAAELAEHELAVRNAARRAGGILNEARVGQHGVVTHATTLLTRTMKDDIKRNTPYRPVAELVALGWRDLIEPEGKQ